RLPPRLFSPGWLWRAPLLGGRCWLRAGGPALPVAFGRAARRAGGGGAPDRAGAAALPADRALRRPARPAEPLAGDRLTPAGCAGVLRVPGHKPDRAVGPIRLRHGAAATLVAFARRPLGGVYGCRAEPYLEGAMGTAHGWRRRDRRGDRRLCHRHAELAAAARLGCRVRDRRG